MENDDVTVVISERSTANLRELQRKRSIEQSFRYDRSNIVCRAQKLQENARWDAWLKASAEVPQVLIDRDEFIMELAATKALNCFNDPLKEAPIEEKTKEKHTRAVALKRSKAAKKKEELASSEYHHHPETRMEHFFERAHSMSMKEQLSMGNDSQSEIESLPSGAASVIDELTRLDKERDNALLKAEDVAMSFTEGNPCIQRADVFERLWVLVSENNPVWKACCAIFLKLKEKAKKNHRQFSACKNCATIFFPFFPAEYHMHQDSAQFKSCVDSRTVGKDNESMFQRALVGLAQEANAYKREGDREYIKLIRMVKGVRGHRDVVKYDRFELCENSSAEGFESTSQRILASCNLAAGVLKLIIQLHFKVPISSRLLRPKLPGAGFADYFQRYRHLVPEFADETLFRCFLVEFGQHVRRAGALDEGFKLNSNWWSGRCVSPASTFVESGWVGVLVELDKSGLVQLAKSLANGTCRVLDDFCQYGAHEDFISCPVVDENAYLQEYLDQVPEWIENEPVEKELLPSLSRMCLATHPEVRDVEMAKKVSKTKLSKRAPELTEQQLRRLEQKRECEKNRRKKGINIIRTSSKICLNRIKMVGGV